MEQILVRQVHGVRRWNRIALSGIAASALAGVLTLWLAYKPMSACEKEIRFGSPRRGVEICLESHARSKNPRDLFWAAKGYLYMGKVDKGDKADELAQQLLAGPLYGDAHGILSYVALRDGSVGDARMHAAIALTAHTLAGDEGGRANDFLSFAQAAWKIGDFTASLAYADESLKLALRLEDPFKEAGAQLARADALRRMGDISGSTKAFMSASARATAPCTRAWAYLKSAMNRTELRPAAQQEFLALNELAAVTQANRLCESKDVATAVALNEAWLLRRSAPTVSLAKLDEVTKSDGELTEILLLRGYLAADRGALGEANGYLARAEGIDALDADWPWEVARARGELSQLRGGLSGELLAEHHYRRAMAMVAALRTTAVARSAYLVSSHRGPYDDLIGLLAHHGRWRDVLAVVLELDASDMLRAITDGGGTRAHASPNLATPQPGSATMPRPTVEDVLSAWRARDLVILIAPAPREIGGGHERAYRLRVTDGQVTGEDVGDASMARTWAGDLFRDPGKQDAARALGRMIVPPGPAAGTLHVLALGALGKVPLAALRDDDGSLSIRRRPLMRVLGLRASGPESQGTRPASIIADPRGNLPSAAVEGLVVAKTLGSGVTLSGVYAALSATRKQLWAARDAALLHVAADVVQLGRWRALHLADGDVDPAEMIQRGLAPRLAVLAGCGSAAALDEEGWGSIAAALLESGTAAVIATDRSVDDSEALSLMRDFYAQPDWRTDPARALARVQMLAAGVTASSNATTQVGAWAAFSVLARPPAVVATP